MLKMSFQKQPSRGVLWQRFSEGDHLWRRVISIKLQSNFIEISLRHGFYPVNLLHIFRTSLYKNTSGGLLICQTYLNIVHKTWLRIIYIFLEKHLWIECNWLWFLLFLNVFQDLSCKYIRWIELYREIDQINYKVYVNFFFENIIEESLLLK